MSAASNQVHFKLDFIMEANNMDSDQTARLGAVWSGSILFVDLGPYCLQYRLS